MVTQHSKENLREALRRFLKKSAGKMLLMTAHRLCLYFGGLIVLSAVFSGDLSLLTKTILALPLGFLAAIGLHNIGLLGHEGTHFTLATNRLKSARIGTVLSAIVPLHFNMGFAVSHAQHHRFTNTEKDPDIKIFSSLTNFWSRMFRARSLATKAYFLNTLAFARNKMPVENMLGLKNAEIFALARLNLTASFFFLVCYLIAIVLFPLSFGIAFGLTYTIAVFLSGLRPYLEHAGTDSRKFSLARTFQSPVLDYIFGTINYHLAHHMYPGVPAYNLPKLHRWLVVNKYIDNDAAINESNLKDLMAALNTLRYGFSR